MTSVENFKPRRKAAAIYINHGNGKAFWVQVDKENERAPSSMLTKALQAAGETFWSVYKAGLGEAKDVNRPK